jgi:hypothetical protein
VASPFRQVIGCVTAGVLMLLLAPPPAFATAATRPNSPAAGAVAAARSDGIGYYNRFDGTFYLRNNPTTAGQSNYAYKFGPVGSQIEALAGDWDGDGKDGIGYYNHDDGTFHLRNDPTKPGPSDYAFGFGPASTNTHPVVGDWNGDGRTGIGYSLSGYVHLRNEARSGGSSNYLYPIVDGVLSSGDWDGNGRDGLAVSVDIPCGAACGPPPVHNQCLHNDATKASGCDYNLDCYCYPYSLPQLVSGDWNGDGRDGVGYNVQGEQLRLGNQLFAADVHSSPPVDYSYDFGPPEVGIYVFAGRWH